MALYCEIHHAYVYDRGGQRVIGSLGNLARVQWERRRDDISVAQVIVTAFTPECERVLGLMRTIRHELVIFRGDVRVWEGPITHLAFQRGQVEVTAQDVVLRLARTVMLAEYNSAYPNVQPAITRVSQILTAELARMEALDPPINVLPHVVLHQNPTDARTASHTLPYEGTVFDHLDTLAARGGIDYVAIGRAIHLFDVDTPLGKAPPVSHGDFIGDVIVTEYGMDMASRTYVTDGRGNAGSSGGSDPFYGLVERVHNAFDETAEEAEAPSVAELASQAARLQSAANPAPVVVRVPDNSRINPAGALSLDLLVPGVWVPLVAEVPGRSVSAWQKIDRVRFEENPLAGERISLTLSPAPHGGVEPE